MGSSGVITQNLAVLNKMPRDCTEFPLTSQFLVFTGCTVHLLVYPIEAILIANG